MSLVLVMLRRLLVIMVQANTRDLDRSGDMTNIWSPHLTVFISLHYPNINITQLSAAARGGWPSRAQRRAAEWKLN